MHGLSCRTKACQVWARLQDCTNLKRMLLPVISRIMPGPMQRSSRTAGRIPANKWDRKEEMLKYYHEKTVLLTGAFGGFGKHFANQLLEAGAKLVLSDVAEKPLADVVRKKEWEQRVLGIIATDLSTGKGCRQLYKDVSSLGVNPDIIIHNAGIGFGGAFVDIPFKNIERVFNVNLMSIAHLNSLFLPGMIRRESGHLIYVSSVAGFVATPFGVAYSASKFGVRAMAMALHGEIKRHGIRTSITYPFWSKTPIMQSQVFGNPDLKTMPDFFADEPGDVVRTSLKGAAKGKLHIRPGFFSKAMWQAVRITPVIAAQRIMRDELIEGQPGG